MTHSITALLALVATASPAPAQPPRDAFVLLAGADTIAVERFTSTADGLDGELVLRSAGLRVAYRVTFDAAGLPLRMTTSATRAAGRADAPAQAAALEFRDDSVLVTGTPGTAGRYATAHGALPYLNPSMAMLERAVLRAHASGRDSAQVPLFSLSGGRTMLALIVRFGADSVRVRLPGAVLRFAVGPDGTLRGGCVPSQGLLIVRASGAASATLAPPDYSAPAGAPYTAEEVRVPAGVPAAGAQRGPGATPFTLAGTLTRPAGVTGAVPCVVTITGSGLQDRDESLLRMGGYRPFRQIADALARAGIATLRLDDRSFGASGGDAAAATSADFADDTRAALAWLRSQPGIDGARLALLGHSEGGLIAPMVAADDPAVRAIVLLAGPAWNGRKVAEYQKRYAIAREPGLPPARRDSLLRAATTTMDSVATVSPWFGFFFRYDPLPTLRRVHCPVLVMQGATDRQVDSSQADELAATLRRAGNRDVTVHVLPGVNHLFLADTSGDPAGYFALKVREIQPAVLDTIATWLSVRLR